ncbi:hypothetical protein HY224_02855 [Candidatus Uhrbacteria bacterium]|nr:hypothetical protein [Candidatus Uhrbacteria bacterium]
MSQTTFLNDIKLRDQLFDPRNVEKITSLAEEILKESRHLDAKILARELDEQLGQPTGDALSPVESNYRRLLSQLKMLAFNLWDDKTAEEIFKNNLADCLGDEDFQYFDRLTARMVEIAPDQRDRFKEKLRQALYLNEQKLTNKYLTVGHDEIPGTVKNWIKDYLRAVGGDTVTSLEKIKYLTASANVRQLNKIEKIKLTALIDLFEYLKLPALSPEGFDEEIIFMDDTGQEMRLFRGIAENTTSKAKTLPIGNVPADKRATSSSSIRSKTAQPILKTTTKNIESSAPAQPLTPSQIMELYHGSEAEQQKLSEAEGFISQQADGDYAKTAKQLIDAILPPPGKGKNKWLALAALKELALNNQIDQLLKDRQIGQLLVKYLNQKALNDAAKNYTLVPATPLNFKLLLQYIFEEALKLAKPDSARWGLQVCSVAKKAGDRKYGDLAYFDMRNRQFVWK